MNKGTVAMIVGMIIVLALASVFVFVNIKPGKVVNINTGRGYDSIQEAISANETLDGHTLVISPGLYRENVEITKSLTVKGQNRDSTVVEQGNRSVIAIRAMADYSTVANVTVRDSHFGIWCQNSKECKVTGNRIINCITGIRIDNCNDTVVKNNEVLNGTLSGIHIYWHSFNTTVTGNRIENLFGDQGYYGAINLESSDHITVTDNWVANSICGMYLYSSATNVTIYHNNFSNNTKQVALDGPAHAVWDDGYPSGGNYWSDYTGEDKNQDGIGDIPYVIDQTNEDRYPFIAVFAPYP
jgi:parallel beta-helix repeat protein